MGRIIRALTGLVLLLGIVVGVPYGLWVYGRSLLPDHVPSLTELRETLFARDSGQIFVSVLLLIGAVAWLMFVFCVILEIVARLTGRERARRIRGLRPAQAGAAALIGLIVPVVMLGGAATASAQTVPTAHAVAASSSSFPGSAARPAAVYPSAAPAAGGHFGVPRPATSATSTVAAAVAAAPTAGHPVWVVSRYDTLWDIAQKTLGDGRQFMKIADLNVGVVQPDGKVLHSDKTPLEIGWRLILPPNATLPTDHAAAPAAATPGTPTHQDTVRAGQTLSEIAQDEYGSADAWPTIAAANHLANPDELDVGQVLTIPGVHAVGQNPVAGVTTAAAQQKAAEQKAAQDNKVAAAEKTAQDKAVAAKAAAEQKAAQDKAAAAAEKTAEHKASLARAAADLKIADQKAADAAAPVGVAPEVASPTVTPAATGAHAAADPDTAAHAAAVGQASDSSHLAGRLELGAFGTAAAGALWLGLLAARRRQRHRRPIGKVKAPTSIPAAKLERRLRDRAGAADVVWMDKALRYAAHLVSSRPAGELPDVTCVWLSSAELQMQLATSVDAPAPFLAEDGSWILSADVDIADDGSWTEVQAPFPALASLGEMDGESLLVDLERLTAVTITGDADRTNALLRHLAVELAHNLWSDYLQVTLVGWGEHLRVLNPDRLRYASSVGDIVTGLRGRLAETADAESELETTLLAGRLTTEADDGGTWSPELYLIDAGASTEQDLATLTDLMTGQPAGQRAAVAVIARRTDSAPDEAATIHIDAAGMLTLPAVLGSMRVHAAGLSEQELDLVVELFKSAGQFTAPGPIQSDEPWAEQMDVTGSLIAGRDQGGTTGLLADQNLVALGDVDDDAGTVGQKVLQLRKPASPAAAAALQAALSGDPELDADLAEWNDRLVPDPVTARREDTSWVVRPRVGVLGAPLVMTNFAAPEDQQNRYVEFVVYFAVHHEVQPTKFAADLWAEHDQPKPTLRTSYVSHTRAWLGINEQGRKHLSEARAGRGYRLTRLLDIEILRRLKKRADAKLAAGDVDGARADLTAGLQLVRGPLLDGVPSDSYSWLTTSDPEQLELAGVTVVGVAHSLAMLALDVDDFDAAREAADVAYRFDPDDDQPKVDHVLIAHRAGDSAAKRGWALQILRAHKAELIEDVENYDTMIALSAVFPNGLRLAEAG